MVKIVEQPLIPLEILDIRSFDQSEDNISANDKGDSNETDEENKLRLGRRNHAKQRKQA